MQEFAKKVEDSLTSTYRKTSKTISRIKKR